MFELKLKRRKLETEQLLKKDIVYSVGLKAEQIIPLIKKYFTKEEQQYLIECNVKSIEDYERLYRQLLPYRNYELFLNDMYQNMPSGELAYPGRCQVCNEEHNFIVNYKNVEITESATKIPNWRESLVCPSCFCNNRMRFMISKVKREYSPGMNVLLYEAGTLIFNKIQTFIPDVIGCMPADQAYTSGQMADGVLYENFEKLSFAQGRFQLIVVNDIFGFMKNYKQLFAEAARVLAEEGKLLMTIPFNPLCYQTEEYEEVSNGLLCQIFGWDIIECLKNCGFVSVSGKVYYSINEAYLGYLPIYFEAIKGSNYGRRENDSKLSEKIDIN